MTGSLADSKAAETLKILQAIKLMREEIESAERVGDLEYADFMRKQYERQKKKLDNICDPSSDEQVTPATLATPRKPQSRSYSSCSSTSRNSVSTFSESSNTSDARAEMFDDIEDD